MSNQTLSPLDGRACAVPPTLRRTVLRAASATLLVVLAIGSASAKPDTLRGEWVAVEGEVHGEPIPEASLPLLRLTFDGEGAGWTIPGYPQRFDYTAHGAPDSLDFRLPAEEPRVWRIPVRSQLRGDTLHLVFPLAGPFDPSSGAPPPRPSGEDLYRSGPFVRLALVKQDEPPPVSELASDEARAADAIDADAIERMTRALVAPEMQGRGSGQPGGERAARLIAAWFRETGLEPLGEEGFLQPVPLFSGLATPTSSLTVGDTTFTVGGDFAIASLPMRTRPAMRADITGDVVLFGPSLGPGPAEAPLPEFNVDGKIVAWIASSGPADGSGSDIIRTYEALHRSGAEAIIILFPGPLPEPFLRSPLFSGIATLDTDLYGQRPAVPVVLLGPQAFGALFGDGSEVRAFMGEFESAAHAVQPTGKKVRLTYEIEEIASAPTYNVAGVIRGSDPDLLDEAVVFTAHYDAFGTHDVAVYTGAADNALGVAEMAEIVRTIRASGVQPRRSVVFLAVGAEERARLGTLHWTRHPTWPLDRVVANINMDGGDAETWGPLHGVIELSRHATLGDVAAEIAATMSLPLLPNDGPAGGNSDFYDFLRAGIPAIQLMGLGGDPAQSLVRLQRFGGQRVHQPGDVIDEGWDWAGPRQMAQLYLLLGLRVANADERPQIRARSPYAERP